MNLMRLRATPSYEYEAISSADAYRIDTQTEAGMLLIGTDHSGYLIICRPDEQTPESDIRSLHRQ